MHECSGFIGHLRVACMPAMPHSCVQKLLPDLSLVNIGSPHRICACLLRGPASSRAQRPGSPAATLPPASRGALHHPMASVRFLWSLQHRASGLHNSVVSFLADVAQPPLQNGLDCSHRSRLKVHDRVMNSEERHTPLGFACAWLSRRLSGSSDCARKSGGAAEPLDAALERPRADAPAPLLFVGPNQLATLPTSPCHRKHCKAM